MVVLYNKDDNPLLAAYVTLENNQQSGMAIDAGVLSTWLKARLPEYMVPASFTVLDKMPLTPNSKIDRKALPTPEPLRIHKNFIKPQTTLEKQISEVWQEVLQLEKVGIHDNFFDLGGHSLLLVQVQSRLQGLLEEPLPVVKLFQYPTVQSLAAHITHNEPKEMADMVIKAHDDSRDIAIIGMAGRFPGAQDIEILWNNLRNGLESIRFFSDEELLESGVDKTLLNNPDYVKAGGMLEGAELFDALFFGYTPKEAEILDPQQRLFLEIAWAGIEHAGYDVERIHVPVGVFAGLGMNTYFIHNLLPNRTLLEALGGYELALSVDKDFISTRIAYKLNLKGPALTIQTACSTSLVSVHIACQSLLNNECEMALAGGISVSFPQKQGYLYQEGMIASPDGHCRAFDATAKGTVSGAGGGVVVLKPLSRALADGDTIHGVIKGTAVNNDGMDKVGFTAPSVNGQAAVITAAMGGLDYESISYIEAHGTGTVLGDPIEINALTQAYRRRTEKTGYCALGSVKTNIGHLDTAAGVAGLIKTVLALKHRKIPPSLNFHTPSPQIDFAYCPFFVITELRPWESPTRRRAGVSSFG
ncbi:MAG: beta-ketoacyl synthase N-terminal-like domain-containing protein, partial [Bacteroidota bacterium]